MNVELKTCSVHSVSAEMLIATSDVVSLVMQYLSVRRVLSAAVVPTLVHMAVPLKDISPSMVPFEGVSPSEQHKYACPERSTVSAKSVSPGHDPTTNLYLLTRGQALLNYHYNAPLQLFY